MFNVERSGEETRKLSHNNDRCVGCGICTDVCPTSSLRLGPIVPIARGLIEMDLVSVTPNTCVFMRIMFCCMSIWCFIINH